MEFECRKTSITCFSVSVLAELASPTHRVVLLGELCREGLTIHLQLSSVCLWQHICPLNKAQGVWYCCCLEGAVRSECHYFGQEWEQRKCLTGSDHFPFIFIFSRFPTDQMKILWGWQRLGNLLITEKFDVSFFNLLPGFKFSGNFHGDKQQLLSKASGNQFPKRFCTWKNLFLRLIWIRLIHSWQPPRRIAFRTGSVAWQIKGFYLKKGGF